MAINYVSYLAERENGEPGYLYEGYYFWDHKNDKWVGPFTTREDAKVEIAKDQQNPESSYLNVRDIVRSVIKEELEIDIDHHYYDGHEITISLKLNNEKISERSFTVR